MNKQSSSTNVPVTIRPDAAARIAELGMQTQLQQMIEHAGQVVPRRKKGAGSRCY